MLCIRTQSTDIVVSRVSRERRPGQTGAGHPEDEDDEDEAWVDEPHADGADDLANAITEDLAHNIRHPAIKVARHSNLIRSAVIEQRFCAALAEIWEEWEDAAYPAMEAINPGTRGKEIVVALSRGIWLPRAIYFAQALDAMASLEFQEETEPARVESGYDSESSSQADVD
ncbi:hypothetical protein B0H14DRAFT_3505481 [Mycena olivaceomarginata]|nr:hypothetical protein B0H14DRAFT_3505481 [Mycena olivaceomarginata]